MSYETTKLNHIAIYTGGACLHNPGVGGWAAAVRRINDGEEVKKRLVSGSSPNTTNNRMELRAAIAGLKSLKRTEEAPIVLFSDSQYLIKGMIEWLPGWITKGWKTAKGKPVENKDLWQELRSISIGLPVDWQWVRGHNGDPWDEEVSNLAAQEARKLAYRS